MNQYFQIIMYTVHAHVKLKKNKNSANYLKNDQSLNAKIR